MHTYPHDPNAFTQGLEYDTDCSDGPCRDVFWESTWPRRPARQASVVRYRVGVGLGRGVLRALWCAWRKAGLEQTRPCCSQ